MNALTRTHGTPIWVGLSPLALLLSPDGRYLYVDTAGGSGTVAVIRTKDGQVAKIIPARPGAAFLAVSPGGRTLYVANQGSRTVTFIDTASGSITKTIHLPGEPDSLAITPDGSNLYIGYLHSSTVDVIPLWG